MALRHPTWNMGAKITIDSATMLNKGFEVIEAHHLFGAEYGAITAVLHPQSIVHSMVEFCDGAVVAQLSNPTMKLPIQLALGYPERAPTEGAELDFSKALSFSFEPISRGRFPCFDIALDCARAGGTLPCVLNAAGEVAVHAFLSGGLKFTDIARVIDGTVCREPALRVESYEQLCETDARARAVAAELIAGL